MKPMKPIFTLLITMLLTASLFAVDLPITEKNTTFSTDQIVTPDAAAFEEIISVVSGQVADIKLNFNFMEDLKAQFEQGTLGKKYEHVKGPLRYYDSKLNITIDLRTCKETVAEELIKNGCPYIKHKQPTTKQVSEKPDKESK